ncbi:2-C-methyl-D-erythritol 4-phosphate cytidylyltransferase [Pseudolysinimonas sp.]
MPALGIIVVAAGSGTRLGHPEPKAFVELRGLAILEHALMGVFDSIEPAQVVVVAPESRLAAARTIARRVAGPADASVSVVAGADSRQGSVLAGLAALAPEVEVVLVHDAARALTPGSLVDRVVRAVRSTGGGVIPALPVADTVKRVADGTVRETVDRSDLVHVQTPQGFPRAALDAAYAAATQEYTDDAALFSADGGTVTTVEGEARAFKITTPWDLRRAENVLGARTGGLRTGLGFDVHAYDEADPLWLGGLYWPDEPGLSGHSDGDAVLHAICDALLSAAGLGDLGSRFGTSDPRFQDAASEVFLKETLALVAGAGFTVVNVSVQVIAARPKIAPRRSELEVHLTTLVGAPVTLGATTTDGLGFTGRAEGIAVVATALLSGS